MQSLSFKKASQSDDEIEKTFECDSDDESKIDGTYHNRVIQQMSLCQQILPNYWKTENKVIREHTEKNETFKMTHTSSKKGVVKETTTKPRNKLVRNKKKSRTNKTKRNRPQELRCGKKRAP
eukprot:scaffold22576_cov129-Cylindrotheca_fusiformis.AAC.1